MNDGGILAKCAFSCGVCADNAGVPFERLEASSACKDASACEWKGGDVCTAAEMRDCPRSCGACRDVCVDVDAHCEEWAAAGECSRNEATMLQLCPLSCRLCSDLHSHLAVSSHGDEL